MIDTLSRGPGGSGMSNATAVLAAIRILGRQALIRRKYAEREEKEL